MGEALRRTVRGIDRLTTGLMAIAASLALALAAGLAFYQVFMRFVVRAPSPWSEPALQMLVIWMVWLGIAVAIRKGALVSMDVLARISPPTVRAVLHWAGGALALVLLGHMVWYGWEMAERMAIQMNPSIGISQSWGFASVPVGSAFAFIAVLAALVDPPPPAPPGEG